MSIVAWQKQVSLAYHGRFTHEELGENFGVPLRVHCEDGHQCTQRQNDRQINCVRESEGRHTVVQTEVVLLRKKLKPMLKSSHIQTHADGIGNTWSTGGRTYQIREIGDSSAEMDARGSRNWPKRIVWHKIDVVGFAPPSNLHCFRETSN